MGSNTVYKRLAEVRLLHSYYLNKDGNVYFALPKEKRERALYDLLFKEQYAIMQDMVIEPVASTAAVLKGQKILYRQTAQGILLGVAVKPNIVEQGLGYQPAIPLSNDLRLQFYMYVKNPAFLYYTSTRLNPVFRACYYFTNGGTTSAKTYPSLSVPMQEFVTGRQYEMGETALIAGNPAQARIRTNVADAANWVQMNDHRYVSEYDRILLPKNFWYKPDRHDITEIRFNLQQNGSIVKSVHVQNDAGLKEVQVDFRRLDNQSDIEDGFYTLSISGSNGLAAEYPVYLNAELYDPVAFGVIDLVINTTQPDFRLTDENGLLVQNGAVHHPVFEIRFLNRATYWKYTFQYKGPEGTDVAWDDLPAPLGTEKVIISKNPLPLTKSYQQIKFDATHLPNANGGQLSLEDERVCSNVLLTKIKQ